MSGGCDVLSLGRDGLLKIDELQSGDTFGESSFQITDHSNSNKIHNHTVITSHDLTELLTIEPVEIENYLASMRVVEQRLIDTFIRKWWPVSSWCWSEVEFEKFSAAAEFIRFNKYDVVHANAADSTASQLLPASALWQFQLERNVYFVIKGKLEMILLLRSEDKTALRVSYLDTNDYFGYFETDLVVRACEDDCELIKISKQAFLSIHSNSSYILSKLIDDYKINTPRGHQVLEFYNQRLRVLKSLKRLEEEKKKSHSGSSKSSPTFRS
jgi:CRP-like cAMP-binding protein